MEWYWYFLIAFFGVNLIALVWLIIYTLFFLDTEWISVDKQMPELYELVIIKRKKFVSAGTFHGEYWWDRGTDRKCVEPNEVTHWKPLPDLD